MNNSKEHPIDTKLKKVSFIQSAGFFKDLPEWDRDEFCILGRSNVGKSSFINHVLNNKNLARVSKKPGKTNLANFFHLSEQSVLVDLPGYGFAKTSHAERDRWSKLILEYCEKRDNLKGIIWLLDIRHDNVKADVEACQWLEKIALPVFPVLTKSDKLKQNEIVPRQKKISQAYGFMGNAQLYTIMKNKARIHFWTRFSQWIGEHGVSDDSFFQFD